MRGSNGPLLPMQVVATIADKVETQGVEGTVANRSVQDIQSLLENPGPRNSSPPTFTHLHPRSTAFRQQSGSQHDTGVGSVGA